MSDALERELRSVLAEKALTLPPDAHERLSQIDFGSRGHSPRLRRVRLRLSAPVTAAATGLAAAAAAVALLLAPGTATFTPFAEAGWTAFPRTPSAADVARATAICEGMKVDSQIDAALSGHLVLSEQRGRYVAALYTGGDRTALCIATGAKSAASVGGGSDGDGAMQWLRRTPPPTRISSPELDGGGPALGFPGVRHGSLTLPPSIAHLQARRARLTPRLCRRLTAAQARVAAVGFVANGYGRAGREVTGVTFLFPDYRPVQATVKHGWYFGWWPREVWPVRIRVRTTSGISTESVQGVSNGGARPRYAYCGHPAAATSIHGPARG
jgi:hypothetical protein